MTNHRLLAVAVALTGATVLTACGGGSDADTGATGSTGSAATPSAAPSGAVGRGMQGRLPGASGLIADISGRTLQVQSQQTGQVAVTWTADTVFTRTVDASPDDVAVGDCVVVLAATGAGSTGSTVTAQTVSVQARVDGSCMGQGGGFADGPGGGFGGGRPSGAPSGPPSDAPSDAPDTQGAGFSPPTIGEVTALGDGTLSVDAVAFGRPAAGQNATPDPSASPTTTSVTVHSTGSTAWTTTVDGSAKQLELGDCATATGEADDTGAVTATAISTRPADDGSCDSGFGPLTNGSPQ